MDALKFLHLPTLDRPFGIELWPIFARGYQAIFGYSPDDFKFRQGQTPMSTFKETVIALISYYIIIFGGRELMKHRQPFVLNGPFMIHNLYLTLISGGLLALFIEQLLPELVRNGIFHAICSYNGGWTDRLVMLYYVSSGDCASSVAFLTGADELPDQIPRTHRYCLSRPQEEAAHFPPHLSPWRDRSPLLHATRWQHRCFLGSYHVELDRPCRHVLVSAKNATIG